MRQKSRASGIAQVEFSLSYILWSSTSPVEQCSSPGQWAEAVQKPVEFRPKLSHMISVPWHMPHLTYSFFFLCAFCSFPFPATKSHASLEQWDRREKWYHQHPSVVRKIKSRCESAVTAPPICTGPHALPHAEVSSSLGEVFETCCFAASCWGCCVTLEHFC